MEYNNPQALVTTSWLADNLASQDMVILDATWHLPTVKRNARSDYLKTHIPGARYFDIDAFSDPENNLPHMLPSAKDFAEKTGAMGIANSDHVIIYDSYGLFSAARVWWMFRIFGHDKISVLNGGSLKWQAEKRPMESGEEKYQSASFKARFRPELICDSARIFKNIDSPAAQILDARAKARFHAEMPEPRPGLRPGHIPGSINLPFTQLLDSSSKEFLPARRLQKIFESKNIHRTKPVICSCGTGVTACVIALGLFLLGKEDAVIYDGSWSEWGSLKNSPVEI